jgi:protein phosphatase
LTRCQDDGHALCVPGNYENKLKRKLNGKTPAFTHGLDVTMNALMSLPEENRDEYSAMILDFIDGLISQYVFDEGKLVVAHAGLKEEMHGRGSGRVREFALYGETSGETDEFGLPVRHNWAAE